MRDSFQIRQPASQIPIARQTRRSVQDAKFSAAISANQATDTLHFGARAAEPVTIPAAPRSFSQSLRELPRTIYHSVVNFLDDFRAIAQIFITIPAGFISLLPMPQSWWSKIQRYVFFRPLPNSGLSRLKDKTLIPKISEHSIDMRPYHAMLQQAGFTVDPANDAVKLHAWHIKAQDGKPTVVFNHGLQTNISKQSTLMRIFSDRGYGVFVYDYPGFGQSGGEPDETSCYKSALIATQFLENELNIPVNQQILTGYSMGSTVSTDVARRLADTFHSQPKALFLINAFPSLRETFRYRLGSFYPWIKPLVNEKGIMLKCDMGENLKHLPPQLPILMLHGKKDRDIPYQLVRDTMTPKAKELEKHNIAFELLEPARHRFWDEDYELAGARFFDYMARTFPDEA